MGILEPFLATESFQVCRLATNPQMSIKTRNNEINLKSIELQKNLATALNLCDKKLEIAKHRS